jgi:transcriptional regulator with XRE-family HTH domain
LALWRYFDGGGCSITAYEERIMAVFLKKALGDRLKQLREEQDLRVEQVAEWTGFDRTHLYAIERGAVWPSVELLSNLAQVYRVDVADLFTFPEEHRRHRLRVLARLVPNAKLPDLVAAAESLLGASLEELTTPAASADAAAASPSRAKKKAK